MKSVWVAAGIFHDKNIDHTEKKAENSDFDRGQLYGENEVANLKKKKEFLLFFRIFIFSHNMREEFQNLNWPLLMSLNQ